MTNKDIGAFRDALKNAKLVAKLVANNYTQPFSPEIVKLAAQYNEELMHIQCTLHKLAEALNS